MKLNEIVYDEQCIITESEMHEMARVKEANSGINVMIYASTKNSVKQRHGPRIKVSNVKSTFSDDNFAVTIEKEPRVVAGKVKIKNDDVENIFDWVKLNYSPLMKYWNDEYSNDADFYHELRSLKE